MKAYKLILLILVVLTGVLCKKDDDAEILEIRTIEGDYFVSNTGDDNNPGTDSLPFKTIQKAVNIISAGQIIVVQSGQYNEFITINNSPSSEEQRIIIFSEALHGAKCKGFKIQGNFITIDGFDVEADGQTNWTGIQVKGNSYVEILNCFIHECPTAGIKLNSQSNFAKIINNKLEHNGQYGISLIGSNALIESNEILRTVQHHPKGHEPGFSGADADGMRIFGNNHTIRSNIVKDIGDPNDQGNIDPHSDCIQTWDGASNGQPLMTNTIIEGNFFSVQHPSGKGIIIDANKGNACHDLIIRNNIFEFRDMGIGAYSGEFHNIYVYNNIFKANIGEASWGTSISFRNVQNYGFINNITVDCHPEHRHIEGGSGTIGNNIAWNSDGSTPTMQPALQTNELSGINPLFTTYTGKHGENDYHLISNSPAINAGQTLDLITTDFDGINRPQGSGYDIGPFEYHTNK